MIRRESSKQKMYKILLLIALLPVIIALDEKTEFMSEYAVDACQNQVDGVFIENLRGCAWFNRCAGRVSVEGRCPQGFVFNPVDQKCDYPENVDCNEPVIDTSCTGNGFRLLPSEYSCSKYTVCIDG